MLTQHRLVDKDSAQEKGRDMSSNLIAVQRIRGEEHSNGV